MLHHLRPSIAVIQVFSEQSTFFYNLKIGEVLEGLYGKIFVPCKNFRGLEYAAGFLRLKFRHVFLF